MPAVLASALEAVLGIQFPPTVRYEGRFSIVFRPGQEDPRIQEPFGRLVEDRMLRFYIPPRYCWEKGKK